MNTAGIYAITHAASGRMYIGSAVNVSGRWRGHKSALSRGCHANPLLQNGWNKHGAGAFTFAVVEAVADVADLTAREQWHMDNGDSHYNIRRRAESNFGLKYSAETCAKMSAAQTGKKRTDEHRAKMSAAQMGNTNNLGNKHADETRAKMSAAKMGNTHNLGRKHSDAHRAKISAAQMGNTNGVGNKGQKQTPERIAAISAGKAAARAKREAA